MEPVGIGRETNMAEMLSLCKEWRAYIKVLRLTDHNDHDGIYRNNVAFLLGMAPAIFNRV